VRLYGEGSERFLIFVIPSAGSSLILLSYNIPCVLAHLRSYRTSGAPIRSGAPIMFRYLTRTISLAYT